MTPKRDNNKFIRRGGHVITRPRDQNEVEKTGLTREEFDAHRRKQEAADLAELRRLKSDAEDNERKLRKQEEDRRRASNNGQTAS